MSSAINLGDELRQGGQLSFNFAPVVVPRPIPRELLHRRKLHTLRVIRDRFLLRPDRRINASTKLIKLGLGRVVGEGADRVGFLRLRIAEDTGRCRGSEAKRASGRCGRKNAPPGQ